MATVSLAIVDAVIADLADLYKEQPVYKDRFESIVLKTRCGAVRLIQDNVPSNVYFVALKPEAPASIHDDVSALGSVWYRRAFKFNGRRDADGHRVFEEVAEVPAPAMPKTVKNSDGVDVGAILNNNPKVLASLLASGDPDRFVHRFVNQMKAAETTPPAQPNCRCAADPTFVEEMDEVESEPTPASQNALVEAQHSSEPLSMLDSVPGRRGPVQRSSGLKGSRVRVQSQVDTELDDGEWL